MYRQDWKSLTIGFSVACFLMLFGWYIGKHAIGQEGKNPTGYFVKVEALNVPEEITMTPIGTFVLYDKTGTKEIWRENVSLSTYVDDAQLEDAIDGWAVPYISNHKRQQALSSLAKTSKIINVKLEHKQ